MLELGILRRRCQFVHPRSAKRAVQAGAIGQQLFVGTDLLTLQRLLCLHGIDDVQILRNAVGITGSSRLQLPLCKCDLGGDFRKQFDLITFAGKGILHFLQCVQECL